KNDTTAVGRTQPVEAGKAAPGGRGGAADKADALNRIVVEDALRRTVGIVIPEQANAQVQQHGRPDRIVEGEPIRQGVAVSGADRRDGDGQRIDVVWTVVPGILGVKGKLHVRADAVVHLDRPDVV